MMRMRYANGSGDSMSIKGCRFMGRKTMGSLPSPQMVTQLLGKMPRFWSSLRRIRLIQEARAVSPSLRISTSSCWRNSSDRRIWKGGERFSFGVDMVITITYINLHGNYHCMHQHQKTQCPIVLEHKSGI